MSYETTKAIIIGGSAGSFPVITKILKNLHSQFNIPIILVLHRLKSVKHGLQEALQLNSLLTIIEPEDKETIKKGFIYLAPSNYHLSLEFGNTFSLSTEEPFNNSRPSIDFTFDSISYHYNKKVVGILLSGANKDGALGMKKIKERGGVTIIQDPKTCVIDVMPSAALNTTPIDLILDTDKIIEYLNDLT